MMKLGCARYLELVERRMELLRTLVRIEGEWRKAFIGLNLEASERCVADEEALCEQIRNLDREIAGLQRSAIGPTDKLNKKFEVDSAIEAEILVVLERMSALHSELKRSNQTRQAILRRSKLTMNALRNLFNSYAPTYAAPAALTTGTIYEENV